MAVSSLVALLGIGLATFLWLKNPQIPARMAAQYPGVHRLLLNKYYVDEVYDATIVQPIKVGLDRRPVARLRRARSSTARSTAPATW